MLAFVERMQQRQNEKFERLVEESTIIKTKTVSAKKLHIYSDAKRKRSLILLLITFLYTVFTKVILQKFSFDLLIVLNIILFASDLYLRLNGNSVWALNHYPRINFVTIVNKLVTTAIFFWGAYLQITELLEYITENKETIDGIFTLYEGGINGTLQCALHVLKEKTIFVLSFAYSIIMFIPIMFFFIKRQIAAFVKTVLIMLALLVPILGIVVIVKWIISFRNFKEYRMIDEETCEINYRKLKNSPKVFFKAILRTLCLVAFAIIYKKATS